MMRFVCVKITSMGCIIKPYTQRTPAAKHHVNHSKPAEVAADSQVLGPETSAVSQLPPPQKCQDLFWYKWYCQVGNSILGSERQRLFAES